jgi:hypothetical protein
VLPPSRVVITAPRCPLPRGLAPTPTQVRADAHVKA